MRKRENSNSWLCLFHGSFHRCATSHFQRTLRRAAVEHLEPRYALNGAPTANPDSFDCEKNTTLLVNAPGVLLNDTDPDPDDTLTVSKVNGSAANVGTTIILNQGGNLTLTANGGFTYVPPQGFDGTDSFTYMISDGHGNLANGNAIIRVVPSAFQENNYSIQEGDEPSFVIDGSGHRIEHGLWLHDIGSVGSGLTDYWRIDPVLHDPATLEFNPLNDSRVLVGPDQPVTWEQLNAWGITNATTSAIVTLKVVDAAGTVDYAQAPLIVAEAPPTVPFMSAVPEGCGATVVLNATFSEANPSEWNTPFHVFVDWNWDFLNEQNPEPLPTPDQELNYVPNGNGTFAVAATSHDYGASGTYFPELIIIASDGAQGLGIITPGHPENPDAPFVVVSSGGGGFVANNDSVNDAVEGTPVSIDVLHNDDIDELPITMTVTQPSHGTATVDATNPEDPQIVYTPLDGDPDDSFTYTVNDSDGCLSTATVYVHVQNVAPTVMIAASQNLGRGPQTTVSGTITDPGILDAIVSGQIDWGDGTVNPIVISGGGGSFSFTAPAHAYETTGDKTILVTATDDDDGAGAGSATITVRVALDDAGTLRVLGTDEGDGVAINAPNSLIRVDSNFLTAPADFSSASVQRMLVDLGAGNDALVVAGNVNKYLIALGGAGDDVITDGPAGSILIGGDGTDTLLGGRGEDLLIAGATTFDSNDAALLSILNEWALGGTFQQRMAHLQGSAGGLNGTNFLNAATILGDGGDIDTLSGGGGTDWLILNAEDIAQDAKKDIAERLL
jgi:Ca2+-binding RTX toxin-like protein